MSKEQRGAIVSVRITDEEQQRLREVALARGTSVSEVVRSVVVREMFLPEPVGPAVSAAPVSSRAEVDRGIFWTSPQAESIVAAGTITIQAGRPVR